MMVWVILAGLGIVGKINKTTFKIIDLQFHLQSLNMDYISDVLTTNWFLVVKLGMSFLIGTLIVIGIKFSVKEMKK